MFTAVLLFLNKSPHVTATFEEQLFPAFSEGAKDGILYKIAVALTLAAWRRQCGKTMQKTELVHAQVSTPALSKKLVIPRIHASHDLG